MPLRTQFYREVAPYFGLGIQLAIAVVAFYLFGNWLDERYGTTPWLGLAGLFLGTLGGFIKFFKTVSDLSKKNSPTKREPS
ncbi:MAG: AtpZ/AtpI family protein [Ignavibacteriales bacterium]|nr:AtpZ/AtpI family protein [Ignavibacteriales bacterium]